MLFFVYKQNTHFYIFGDVKKEAFPFPQTAAIDMETETFFLILFVTNSLLVYKFTSNLKQKFQKLLLKRVSFVVKRLHM